MKVLVVEQDDRIRTLMRRWLEGAGAEVHEAASAEAAVAVLELEDAPAVAFCDVRLPGVSGLWLLTHLREHCPTTAVVVATGVCDCEVAYSCVEHGALEYIVKPFTREQLLRALWRADSEHRVRVAMMTLRFIQPLETDAVPVQ